MVSSWHNLDEKKLAAPKPTAKPKKKVQSQRPKISTKRSKLKIEQLTLKTIEHLSAGWSFEYAINQAYGSIPPRSLRRIVRSSADVENWFEEKMHYHATVTRASFQARLVQVDRFEKLMPANLNQERATQIASLIETGYSLVYAYTMLYGPVIRCELLEQAKHYSVITAALARKKEAQTYASRTVKKPRLSVIETELDATREIIAEQLKDLLGKKWKLVAIEQPKK